MSFNKRKRKGMVLTLKIILGVLILISIALTILISYKKFEKHMEKKNTKEQQEIIAEMTQFKRIAYVPIKNLRAGEILTSDVVMKQEIYTSVDASQLMTKDDLGKSLIIDIPVQTPIMKQYLADTPLSDDMRETEYQMLQLQSNLEQNKTIDIRIMFPNGADMIVVSHAMVQGIDTEKNILRLWLTEEEMLRMSSAIVDAYLTEGTKLYTVTYIAPGVQQDAIPTYPVNQEVLKLMKENPNIVTLATKELSERARKQLEENLQGIDEKQKNIPQNIPIYNGFDDETGGN